LRNSQPPASVSLEELLEELMRARKRSKPQRHIEREAGRGR
jgi:hypothetical protein